MANNKKEAICNDPYGSAYARSLDKLEPSIITTLVERRIDLSLENVDLFTAFYLNRINNDDISMVQSSFKYCDKTTMDTLNAKYAGAR